MATTRSTGSTGGGSGRRTVARPRTTGIRWLWLSAPLAGLVTVASAAGVLSADTYRRDAGDFAAQGRAQDHVTLFLAVPLLLVTWRLAAQGSTRARLAWHGVVFYLAYTYVVAVFMVRFNDWFLVYTSAVACSLFALLGSLAGSDGWAEPTLFDAERWPRRPVAVLLSAIVVLFAFLWLGDIVPALVDGVEPASLAESGTPTNGVEAIDLSFLLPAMALVARWVWRGEARGFALATGLLTYAGVLSLALVAMVIGQFEADYADSLAPALLFAVLAAVTGLLLVRALRATRAAGLGGSGGSGPAPTGAGR